MTKAEFIDSFAEKFNSKKDAEFAADTVVDAIGSALSKEGDTLTLAGIGTFKVVKRPARTGRNPRTGETIQIPETLVLKFKQSKSKEFNS